MSCSNPSHILCSCAQSLTCWGLLVSVTWSCTAPSQSPTYTLSRSRSWRGEHGWVRKVAAARGPAGRWCPSPVPQPGCRVPACSLWDDALLPREQERARSGQEPNWLQSCQAGGSWASLTLMQCPASPNPGRFSELENKCMSKGEGEREVSVQVS